jgi:predicted glycogen debranching enzyme
MPAPDVPFSLPSLRVDRRALLNFQAAQRLEWLITNGLGGYASGTVLGVDTRRYHGLLIAALNPPLGRTQMLARVHEELETVGDRLPLYSAEYLDGTVHPDGYLFLDSFHLDGTLPTWRYRIRDVQVEKTVWLAYGRNTVYARYRLVSGAGRVRLRLQPFVTYRDHHTHTRNDGAWEPDVKTAPGLCRVTAYAGAVPLWLSMRGSRFFADGTWYLRFLHRRERERGMDDAEDLFTPGSFSIDLSAGDSTTLVATVHQQDAEREPPADPAEERARQEGLIERARAQQDPVRARLVLAADQFLAQRGDAGRTVLAGYHWDTDWCRDALVALPGVCLSTGRTDEARAVLRTLVEHLDHGMLPVHFRDPDHVPVYNGVDTSLWLFHALEHYHRASGDFELIEELMPALHEVINAHQWGARHGIGVDLSDGLLRAGVPGVATTWMDTPLEGSETWMGTPLGGAAGGPRQGKAVEVQALWYNALRLMADWMTCLGHTPVALEAAAERCRQSFNRRFWNRSTRSCFDVVDGPGGDDPALRPNQLLAASLTHPVLDERRWKPMLRAVETALLTPVGVRTLAPGSPGYVGRYNDDNITRSIAAHQGCAWPWLLGPYVDVARRVRGPQWNARPAMDGLVSLLDAGCLGQVGELFAGDSRHVPGGSIAKAWSVGELLRVWPVASAPAESDAAKAMETINAVEPAPPVSSTPALR